MRLSPQSLQVLAGLLKETGGVREERKIWSMALVAIATRFGADSGAVYLYRRGRDDLYKVRSLKGVEVWDGETVRAFFHNRKPELSANIVMAPVRAGRDVVGVLVLGGGTSFEAGVGKEATEMLKTVGSWVGLRRDLARLQAECAAGVAAMRGVAPKDVAYKILHYLRRFIDYNHGATVIGITGDREGSVLARQIAWSKGKSELVGRAFRIDWEQVPFDGGPFMMACRGAPALESVCSLREDGSPAKESAIVGPLQIAGARLGIVEISSSTPDFFRQKDVATLGGFLPCLAWCVGAFSRQ